MRLSKEELRDIRVKYHVDVRGKYHISLIEGTHNILANLTPRFNTLEDAIGFIREVHPHKKFRVFHFREVDNNLVEQIIDYREE